MYPLDSVNYTYSISRTNWQWKEGGRLVNLPKRNLCPSKQFQVWTFERLLTGIPMSIVFVDKSFYYVKIGCWTLTVEPSDDKNSLFGPGDGHIPKTSSSCASYPVQWGAWVCSFLWFIGVGFCWVVFHLVPYPSLRNWTASRGAEWVQILRSAWGLDEAKASPKTPKAGCKDSFPPGQTPCTW